ncbi:MAG: YicC family protein [Deltaproteobacteria bacterium]|nr:YicC family protein [Deltaproteobacteria bacterium]
MLESMTGFGLGEASIGDSSLHASVRCVNHRFLDLRVHLAPELSSHQAQVESLARERISRGRVELSVKLTGASLDAPVLDVARARAALEQLRELRDHVCPDDPLPLSLLGSVPGLFRSALASESDAALPALRSAVTTALEDALQMRKREGEAMAQQLAGTLERVRAHLAQLGQATPRALAQHRDRLRARLARLLEGTGTVLHESRLELEVALLAERTDIAEETTRLASHADQFAQLMQSGDGMLGRKLEFLLQEMGREANTIGAKSNDSEIAALVIELKADVERMRELVLNVV